MTGLLIQRKFFIRVLPRLRLLNSPFKFRGILRHRYLLRPVIHSLFLSDIIYIRQSQCLQLLLGIVNHTPCGMMNIVNLPVLKQNRFQRIPAHSLFTVMKQHLYQIVKLRLTGFFLSGESRSKPGQREASKHANI